LKRIDRSVARLVLLIAAIGSTAVLAAAARAGGTLELSGGITAHFKLDRANCVAGPGDTFSVNAGSGGGWDALSLTAFDPGVGRRGTAVVDLDETGFRNAPYAVADWGWTAHKGTGHISHPLNIAADGKIGVFSVVLAVSDSYQGPKTRPVEVTATWSARTCKA
jgi:hypothetical protein